MTVGNLGWRIASTEAGLQIGAFFARGIPPPDVSDYRDYSERKPQSQGGQARHGYKNITLVWNRLDTKQSNALREVIQAGIDNVGDVYLTLDRSNGSASGRDWIDVYGKPQMPDFEVVANSGGKMHGNVEFVLNAITIVNDPASF